MPTTQSKPAPASNPETDAELGSAADAVVDTLTATQQEALQSLETARAAMLDGLGRVQREVAEFVSERIRTDMATQAALMRCKTFDEVRSVQTDFLRTAMDQYSSEASRLMRLGGEVVTKSLERNGA